MIRLNFNLCLFCFGLILLLRTNSKACHIRCKQRQKKMRLPKTACLERERLRHLKALSDGNAGNNSENRVCE